MALTDEQMQEARAHAVEVVSDMDYMEELLFDMGPVAGVETACEEGCMVELDGVCPHGFPSPLRLAGMI